VGAGLLAKAVCQSTSILTDAPPSRASPLPHLKLSAPPEGTVNRNRARQRLRNPASVRNRTPIEETRKPRITGLSALLRDFLFQLVKTWHAPCNSLISDADHHPVSGTLVQAGRGFPSLHRAHTAQATSPQFWGPWYRQAGDSLFTPGSSATREPSRFGDLGTGRPGIPSFIAPGDGSPAASGHRPRYRPTHPAGDGPPPASTTIPRHSSAPASSHPCR